MLIKIILFKLILNVQTPLRIKPNIYELNITKIRISNLFILSKNGKRNKKKRKIGRNDFSKRAVQERAPH